MYYDERKPLKDMDDYRIWANVETSFCCDDFNNKKELRNLFKTLDDRLPTYQEIRNKKNEGEDADRIIADFIKPGVLYGFSTPQCRGSIRAEHLEILQGIKMRVKKEFFSLQIKDFEIAKEVFRKLIDDRLIFDGEVYKTKFEVCYLFGERNEFELCAKYWDGKFI